MKIWFEKHYSVRKYDIEVWFSSRNAIFDFWICKDNWTIDIDGRKPFWYLRFAICKLEINIGADIFYGWHTHETEQLKQITNERTINK